MAKTYFLIASLLTLAFSTTPVLAQDSSPDKWGTTLTVGGKIGNHRDLGYTRIFAPLAQDEDQLIFGDLRYRTDPGTDWEGNAGLGYRFITDDKWIVGMYGFFDMRQSPADNMFKQITLGMEYMNVDWDFRGNVYIPDQSKELVSQSSSASVANNQVFIQNAQIKERALPGVDAEVGYRIPAISDDFRVYAGAYHFESSDSDDITGGRVRAQIAFDGLDFFGEDTQIRFNAESQYDDVRKDNHFIGAEVVIPLYSTGKRKHLSPIEKRMSDPIVRDVDVVTGNKQVIGAPEVAKASLAGGSAEQVYVVSETNSAAFSATVAALPSDSLIIVQNPTPVVVNATIALKENQSVIGSSEPIVLHTASGHSVTLAPATGGLPELVRSNAMIAGTQPLFTLAQNGNHIFKDIRLTNEDGSFGGITPMISNGGSTPIKVTLDGVNSDGALAVYITSGSTTVNVANSNIHGADFRTENSSSMNISLTNNTIDRFPNLAVVFGQPITSSVFFEALNNSTMVVEEVTNNVIRDQFAKLGGRVPVGLGFLNSSTTAMVVKKVTGNEISRDDGLAWDGGAILYQATGGRRIIANELHDNTGIGNSGLELVNTDMNIGKQGVTADGAGLVAANPGFTYFDSGGNIFTNN